MRNYIVEFLGTLLLMFFVGMVVVNPTPLWFAPMSIGAILIALVYAGGPISGAHYNPSVTIAFWLRGRIGAKDAIIYIIIQLAAAIAVSYLVLYMKGFPDDTQALTPDMDKILIAEFIGTFVLCYVYLSAFTSQKGAGNSYYGMAVGFAVIAGSYALANSSGAFFNPTVSFGQSIIEKSSWDNLWIYLVAQLLAGITAGFTFKFVEEE
ncbi:MAG: aquaporin [Cyclobacteriaceae bacterium]